MRQFLLGLSFSVVFALGCGAGVMMRQQVAHAAVVAGEWQCFSANADNVANWTESMNRNAKDVPQGAAISIAFAHGIVCVKH